MLHSYFTEQTENVALNLQNGDSFIARVDNLHATTRDTTNQITPKPNPVAHTSILLIDDAAEDAQPVKPGSREWVNLNRRRRAEDKTAAAIDTFRIRENVFPTNSDLRREKSGGSEVLCRMGARLRAISLPADFGDLNCIKVDQLCLPRLIHLSSHDRSFLDNACRLLHRLCANALLVTATLCSNSDASQLAFCLNSNTIIKLITNELTAIFGTRFAITRIEKDRSWHLHTLIDDPADLFSLFDYDQLLSIVRSVIGTHLPTECFVKYGQLVPRSELDVDIRQYRLKPEDANKPFLYFAKRTQTRFSKLSNGEFVGPHTWFYIPDQFKARCDRQVFDTEMSLNVSPERALKHLRSKLAPIPGAELSWLYGDSAKGLIGRIMCFTPDLLMQLLDQSLPGEINHKWRTPILPDYADTHRARVSGIRVRHYACSDRVLITPFDRKRMRKQLPTLAVPAVPAFDQESENARLSRCEQGLIELREQIDQGRHKLKSRNEIVK